MKKIKVRKIGNSIGGIFPKEWGLHEGDLLNVRKEGQLIEESFADFENKTTTTEQEMEELFGKYGWGD